MALNLEELDSAISRVSQRMYRAVGVLTALEASTGPLEWDDIQSCDNALGMTKAGAAELSAVITKLLTADPMSSTSIDARLAAKAGFADIATLNAQIGAVQAAADAFNAARETLYASWTFSAAEVVSLDTVGNPSFRFTGRVSTLSGTKADQLRGMTELAALIAAFEAAGVVA